MLDRAGLVKDTHTIGNRERTDLHREAATIVVEIRLLCVAGQELGRRDGNVGNIKGSGRNDGTGHLFY